MFGAEKGRISLASEKEVHKDHFRRYSNNPGGLDHGDSGGDGKKWLNSGYVLNLELTGFAS